MAIKSGLSRQVVFGDRFNYIEMWDLLPGISGLSRQVVFHGSGLSRQVLLYLKCLSALHLHFWCEFFVVKAPITVVRWYLWRLVTARSQQQVLRAVGEPSMTVMLKYWLDEDLSSEYS